MENAMQTLLPGFFILITVVILGMLVYLTLKGMQEKKANDAAPIVTVDAKVKAKRIAVHHSAHQQSMNGVPLMATPPIMPPSPWRATSGWSCK